MVQPTGSVSFQDTTDNYTLGTKALGAATLSQTFPTQTPYSAGNGTDWVAVGDFNNDGYPDAAVTNENDNTVTIFLGNASGTLVAQANPPATSAHPYQIVVGDFNGDGKLDLAVADRATNPGEVSLLLGNGDGTFQTHVEYPTGGTDPNNLAVGDFNGDGYLDLAIPDPATNTVRVLLGTGTGSANGTGAFQTPAVSTTLTTTPGGFAAAGDFNGDGKLDLAVLNSNNTVSVLLGSGNGQFVQQSPASAVGNGARNIAVGDFNGDGLLDLAVTNVTDGTVSVLLNTTNGGVFSLGTQSPYVVGSVPVGIAVGDFNGDGIADLAVGNHGSSTVSILLGSATQPGHFAAQFTGPTSASPNAIAVGDFNGDGNSDVITANNGSGTLSLLLNSVTQTAVSATLSNVSIPGPTGGSHNVDASYPLTAGTPSTTTFAASIPATTSLTTSPIGTTTTLTAPSPGGSSTYGQSVTLTASVTLNALAGFSTTGDTVTFYIAGTTPLGTAQLNSSGTASLPVSKTGCGSWQFDCDLQQ